MKYRNTGAWWFFTALWRYYLPHLERPVSDSQHFFIGTAVVPQDSLLPVLRALWARHLRSQRLDKAIAEAGRLRRYRDTTGSGDPVWRYVVWPALCAKRRFVAKAYPRLTADHVLQSIITCKCTIQ